MPGIGETGITNFDWSYEAYNDWAREEEERERSFSTKSKAINFIINLVIALAFILGFLGFVLFPQVFLPATLALQGCLICSQALSGFAIFAAVVKTGHAVIEMGWKNTLRMMLCGPRRFFEGHTVQACLLLLGFVLIGAILVLSGIGIINVPFLTVFAAKGLSLEITEILWGLLSDIAGITVVGMTCYLLSLIGRPIDQATVSVIPDIDNSLEHDTNSGREEEQENGSKKMVKIVEIVKIVEKNLSSDDEFENETENETENENDLNADPIFGK